MLEWADLWKAMDASNTWVETTEGMYWQMLEVLPPVQMTVGAFMVGEAVRDDDDGEPVHAMFREVGDKFYAKNVKLSKFWEACRETVKS